MKVIPKAVAHLFRSITSASLCGPGFLAKSIGSTFQTTVASKDNAPVRYLTDTIP